MQQGPERCDIGGDVTALHLAIAHLHRPDREWRPRMGQAGAREELVDGGEVARAGCRMVPVGGPGRLPRPRRRAPGP
jgi:hypothetical protein